MTTANYPDSPTAAGLGGGLGGDAGSSSTGAKEQAKQAAGTAADEGRHVAGVASGEAQRVASEAKSQVRGLVDQATSQVEEQSRGQLDRLAQTLRSYGEDLERMASQGEGPASGLAQEAADRVRGLSSQLEGREPRDVLDDVRRFARRRPGAFLLGALAAGVVAGRLTRGAKEAQSGSDTSNGHENGHATGYGTASPSGRTWSTPGTAYDAPDVPPTPDTGNDPASGVAGGVPNPAASVAGDTTWSETTSGSRR